MGYLGPRNASTNQHILRLNYQSLLPSSILSLHNQQPGPSSVITTSRSSFPSRTEHSTESTILPPPSGILSSTTEVSPSPPYSVIGGSNYTLQDSVYFYGSLYVFNTVEQFKECNKDELLYKYAYQRYSYYNFSQNDNVHNAETNSLVAPSAPVKFPRTVVPSDFVLLVYINLKDYTFIYWFGFPCLVQQYVSSPSTVLPLPPSLPSSTVTDVFPLTLHTVTSLSNHKHTNNVWNLAFHYILKCYSYYHQSYTQSTSSSSANVVKNIYMLPVLIGIPVIDITNILRSHLLPSSVSSALSLFIQSLPIIEFASDVSPVLSYYLLSMNEYTYILSLTNNVISANTSLSIHPIYILVDLAVSTSSSSPSLLVLSWYHRNILNDLFFLASLYSSIVSSSSDIQILHYRPNISQLYFIADKVQVFIQKNDKVTVDTILRISVPTMIITDKDKENYQHYGTEDTLRLLSFALKPEILTTGMKNYLSTISPRFPSSSVSSTSSFTAVGWEPNNKQQYIPRKISLQSSFNSAVLANTAVNLNLSLMKWRMLPELDISYLAQQRILILGCGTLGCYLSRILLGWGFHSFTFVDSGTVSYGNPVRQPLYEFNDALLPSNENITDSSSSSVPSTTTTKKNKYKAYLAAQALQRILPSVRTESHVLEIPMPGHSINSEYYNSKTKNDLDTLHTLIQSHDILFLLTDTRESRWLPTLWGAYYQKLVFTIGLGYDNFLVMRHGMYTLNNIKNIGIIPERSPIPNNISGSLATTPSDPAVDRLGCYFCTDTTVSAPTNSTVNRSMDQQCTITRPGGAPMACSLAAELLVSILHHQQKGYAPGYDNYQQNVASRTMLPIMESSTNTVASSTSSTSSPLGIVPHQIRFFMNSYSLLLAHTKAFQQCPACSPSLLKLWYDYSFGTTEPAAKPDRTIGTDQTTTTSYSDNSTNIIMQRLTNAQYDWLYSIFNGSTDIIENITGFTIHQKEYEKFEAIIETFE